MNKGKTIVFKGKSFSNYTVKSDGRVFNVKTGKELKHSYVGERHDPAVCLYEKGKAIVVKVALLVLETYKGRPAPLTDNHSALTWSVNHIDEDPTNDNLYNLEWLTVSANAKAYWANRKKK